MNGEKLHYLCVYWLSVNFTFTMGFVCHWARKTQGQITAQRTRVGHCATKTGRVLVFSGCCPQVAMEELGWLWKLNTAKEKETRWWRRQRKQRGRVSWRSDRHSVDGVHRCRVKVCSPRRFKTGNLSTRSVYNWHAYLFIQRDVFVILFIALLATPRGGF